MLTWIKGLFTAAPPIDSAVATTNMGLVPHEDWGGKDDQPAPIWIDEPPAKIVRRADQSLARLGVGSAVIRRRLAAVGIESVGELARCDVSKLRKDGVLGRGGCRWLSSTRRVCRLYLRLPPLRIVDARLLVAVYRTRVAAIAGESAIRLHRDLQRFIVSTEGQQVLGKKSPPTLADVEAWVSGCQLKKPASGGLSESSKTAGTSGLVHPPLKSGIMA